MKIGILADIHAQPRALRRTLADMPSVDRLLCAGDAISEYRFCAETVALLQAVGAECVRGNHEQVLFGGANPQYLARCQAETPPELLAMLATAPVSFEFEVTGEPALMVHASPWSPFSDYIMPQSPLLARFLQLPYRLVILGHTHVPMVQQVDGVTIINPGSCAQPRDQDPRGSYAVLDTESRTVVIRRLRLD